MPAILSQLVSELKKVGYQSVIFSGNGTIMKCTASPPIKDDFAGWPLLWKIVEDCGVSWGTGGGDDETDWHYLRIPENL